MLPARANEAVNPLAPKLRPFRQGKAGDPFLPEQCASVLTPLTPNLRWGKYAGKPLRLRTCAPSEKPAQRSHRPSSFRNMGRAGSG